jgi:hypothetical protein
MAKRAILLAILLLVSTATLGAQEGPFLRVLVPLLIPPEAAVAGANGSRWATDAWFVFGGREAIVVRPRTGGCIITCPVHAQVLSPGLGASKLRPDVDSGRGFFLYLPADHASELTFQVTVRDLSRAASAGTTLPVVREDAFREKADVVNVPLDGNVRVSVRLYALPEVAAPEVTIRYLAMFPEQEEGPVVVLREQRVRLTAPQQSGDTPFYPWNAMVSNVEALPELAGAASVWLQVVAETPEARVWPLVSVTDNDTQYVMLLWPQP